MSIKTKLILSFSLAVLFPLVLLAVANTFIFKNQTKTSSLSRVKITLSGAKRIYHSQGNKLKDAFLISSYNPLIIRAISRNNLPFLKSLSDSYKRAFNFADFIGITDAKGAIIASSSDANGYKPSLSGTIFNSFRSGLPVTGTSIIQKFELSKLGIKSSGSPGMFLIAVVPFESNGKIIGSIFGLIDLNDNNYIPGTIYSEYHLKTGVFAAVFNTQTCISTNRIPGNIFGMGSRIPSGVQDGLRSGKDFIHEIKYNGNDIFAAFHPIKDPHGKIIGSLGVFISNREYLALFAKTAAYATAIILIGLIISFIISFIASGDTLKPIFAIISAIKSFSSGDVNTSLNIETKDEFEDIGKGFTEMVSAVRDRQERMEKYNTFSDFLSSSLDFDVIISSTLDMLEQLLNLSSGIIYIYERYGNISPSGEESGCGARVQFPAETEGAGGEEGGTAGRAGGYLIPWKFYGIRKFVARKIDVKEGLAGHCLTTRKTIWFHDIPENAVLLKEHLNDSSDSGKTIDYGFCEAFPKDIAWLPLYVGHDDVGVLMVSTIYGFSKEDKVFLEHAAKGLSVALDNSKLHNKLKELSITDQLTGLYNRRKLDEIIENEFNKSQRYKSTLSILMLDIDHFKSINDSYGHKTGDIVLSGLGRVLKESIRITDSVARYGGEEFLIILPQTSFHSALEVAKKIKQNIQDHKFPQLNRGITVSIGIASLPDSDINTEDDFLRVADDNLFDAKNGGRNRIIGVLEGRRIEVD